MLIDLIAKLLIVLLPWPMRRIVLCSFLGYKIHPSCRIGLSWVFPKELVMEQNSKIGNLTVCKGLQCLDLGPYASIGNLNWITGFPHELTSSFQHRTDRRAALKLEQHSAITHRHLIDCTDQFSIGEFSILAGFHTQVLTHSIDLENCRQNCTPITIGRYCFVGTRSLLLDGSGLPDFSVLAAGSVLTKAHSQTHRLYVGAPAQPVGDLPCDWAYFLRSKGFVS